MLLRVMTASLLGEILFAASLCQLFIFILFLVYNWKVRLNLVLGLILFITGCSFVSLFYLINGQNALYFPFAKMVTSSGFCIGPLLYMYLGKHLTGYFLKPGTVKIHLFFFAAALIVYIANSVSQMHYFTRPPQNNIYAPMHLIYGLFYYILSFRIITGQRRFYGVEHRNMVWPFFLVTANLTLFLSGAVFFIIAVVLPGNTFSSYLSYKSYLWISDVIVPYFMIFVLFINAVFLSSLLNIHIFLYKSKYKQSRLDPGWKTHYEDRILEWMKNEKPYRNPLLSLNSMARSLHISPKYLSQIINERFTQNFSDFINSYRVQETIDLINQGDQSRTILDISHEAGFNAKSTFNLVFKKHTGISPREYMKKIAGSSSGKRLSFIR